MLVQYETPTGRFNKGVATTFLSLKHPQDGQPLPRVPIFIRKSQFRLPTKTETPVIMIGPGTGLAPFRGFIQERDVCRKEGKTVGDTILYFGCRKRSEDYIYEEVTIYWSILRNPAAITKSQKEFLINFSLNLILGT